MENLLVFCQDTTNHFGIALGMESKSGENFLSLQCKDKGEGGGLRILLVKIAIHNRPTNWCPNWADQSDFKIPRKKSSFHTSVAPVG